VYNREDKNKCIKRKAKNQGLQKVEQVNIIAKEQNQLLQGQ